jgi:hypothetical protein
MTFFAQKDLQWAQLHRFEKTRPAFGQGVDETRNWIKVAIAL